MSPARTGRTQPCSLAQGHTRLEHARKFQEVAELTAAEADPDYTSVAAALAVLAGIAASDAACCKALGRRSRGQDHHTAGDLVRQIEPGGKDAANALRRLINTKRRGPLRAPRRQRKGPPSGDPAVQGPRSLRRRDPPQVADDAQDPIREVGTLEVAASGASKDLPDKQLGPSAVK